jgi:DNA-binding transcriptional MocR family regulator
MSTAGRISARQLAQSLGTWRRHGSRHGAADLAAGVRFLVLDGRLPAGTGLPAERELAAALDVSRTMVAGALDRLRADGLVVSRRGAGSWTAVPQGATAGRTPTDGGAQVIDFARAVPSAMPGIAEVAQTVLPRLATELGGHGHYEQGLPELRERIAERYTERGLPTTPDEVLVTNGAHHGLALALRLLVGPGDRVLIEQPTYPNAIEAIHAAHALPVPVAMTDDGWDLEGIEATLRQVGPRLAYLLLDFQNPTGHQLDAEGRERLAAALRRTRTPVVVDETQVELDLRAKPAALPPLGAFAGDLVLATGSAGKSHWGGLRMGWVRASADIVNRLLAIRRGLDLGSPVFEQLLLAGLLAEGQGPLRERRALLATQRDALVAAVRQECPDWAFRVPDGGLSLWCRLPKPVSTRIAAVAQNFGVRVVPGSFFAPTGGLERWLRLPYTRPVDDLREAAHRLSLAAASVAGTGAPAADNGLIPVT